MIAILIIVLIIIGNIITQAFLQYCATNPVSFGYILTGYCSISLIMSLVFVIGKIILDVSKNEYKNYINTENITPEFKILYEKLKAENINELESLRKKVLIKDFFFYFGICLVFSVVFLMGVVAKNVTNEALVEFSNICEFIPFVGGFIAILFAPWEGGIHTEYIRIYKENVLPRFIKLINPDLTYDYKKYQKYEDYKSPNEKTEIENAYIDADFDGLSFDYITEEDWVEGQIDENNFFKITDIKVKEEYRDSDGDTRTHTLFEGLFYSIETDKNIGTCLKININKNNAIEGAKDYQVTMDNHEFEDVFDVYCDDKILAMRILTTDIMEIIMNFYKKYYIPFEICYRNNRVYTRFFVENMFEPRKIKSSMDIKSLYIYYVIVEFAIEFSKKINKLAESVEI